MVGNDFRRDGTQVETLAAGKNGRQDFVRFRGREDEFDVLGRLFQRFQKCVEGFLRKHVHLVYINNAEVASAGCKAHIVPQIPDVVDTPVGSAVDFQNIQAAAFRNLLANIFVRVEVHLRATGTIQGFCENSGSGCFSCAAGAYEKIRMCEAIVFNGIFQRLDDVILSKDVIECQRTIFSGKDLVTHGSGRLKDAALFEKKIECNCFKALTGLRF